MIWNITGMILNIVIFCVGICKKIDPMKLFIFFLYCTYKLSIQLKVKEALGYDFFNQVGRFLSFKRSARIHTIVPRTFFLFKNVNF